MSEKEEQQSLTPESSASPKETLPTNENEPQEKAPVVKSTPAQLALEKLFKDLDERDFRTRNEAIKSLGKLNNPRIADKFFAIAESTEWNTRLRVAAIDGLRKYNRDPRYSRLLQKYALDPKQDKEVRRTCITHLSRFKDPKLISIFLKAMEDEYRFIRFWAIRGLVKIQDPKATNALAKALGDEDEEIRKEAAAHLEFLGEDAVPSLIKTLNENNENKFMRYGIIGLLGRINHPRSAAILINALQDPNDRVVALAIRGLSKIKTMDAVKPLMDLYKLQEDKRRIIESALYSIGSENQKAIIFELVPFLLTTDIVLKELIILLLQQFSNSYLFLSDLTNNPTTAPELKTVLLEIMQKLD